MQAEGLDTAQVDAEKLRRSRHSKSSKSSRRKKRRSKRSTGGSRDNNVPESTAEIPSRSRKVADVNVLPTPAGKPMDNHSRVFCALLVQNFLKIHGFEKSMAVFNSELRLKETLDFSSTAWDRASEQQTAMQQFIARKGASEELKGRSTLLEDIVHVAEIARQQSMDQVLGPSDEVVGQYGSSSRSQSGRNSSAKPSRNMRSKDNTSDCSSVSRASSSGRGSNDSRQRNSARPRRQAAAAESDTCDGVRSNSSHPARGEPTDAASASASSASQDQVSASASSLDKTCRNAFSDHRSAAMSPLTRAKLLEKRSEYVRKMCDEAVQNMLATLNTPQGKEALKREQENQSNLRRMEKKELSELAKGVDREAFMLRKKFAMYDVDGSGCIDKVEFKLLMCDLSIPHADAQSAFGTIDTDGSGTIQFEEFSAWFHSEGKGTMQKNWMKRKHMLILRKYRNSTGKTDLHHARRALLMETATKTRNIALKAFHLTHPALALAL